MTSLCHAEVLHHCFIKDTSTICHCTSL